MFWWSGFCSYWTPINFPTVLYMYQGQEFNLGTKAGFDSLGWIDSAGCSAQCATARCDDKGEQSQIHTILNKARQMPTDVHIEALTLQPGFIVNEGGTQGCQIAKLVPNTTGVVLMCETEASSGYRRTQPSAKMSLQLQLLGAKVCVTNSMDREQGCQFLTMESPSQYRHRCSTWVWNFNPHVQGRSNTRRNNMRTDAYEWCSGFGTMAWISQSFWQDKPRKIWPNWPPSKMMQSRRQLCKPTTQWYSQEIVG